MPDILASVIPAEGVTLGSYLITTAAALLCGVLTALAAAFRHRVSGGFLASLILLPVIVETVILMLVFRAVIPATRHTGLIAGVPGEPRTWGGTIRIDF